jgi:hypothetical protein
LLQVYSTYFGPDSLWELYQRPTLGNWVQQEYRTSLQVPAVINSPENFDLCEILDLTSSGCYLTTTSALPMVNDRICVTFYFEDQLYCTEGQVVWRNEGSVANRRRGFGFRFDEQLSSLKGQLLGNWPYQGCA